MSEERFYITDTGLGLDTESDEMYNFGDEEDFCRLFDKLNEQQAIINKLNDELELTANTKLYSRRELERKVDEQQAEIERLQKIIDLTQYQLNVQDRIIQKMEENE